MSAPTPAVQPHWKAEVKLMSLKLDVGKHGEHDDSDDQVSKDKELKNKSVKDKRPGLKKDDLRDHMSECNDEDEDQSLNLDVERHDEDEDQSLKLDVGQHGEHDDSHDQVSRRLNSQAAGVETRDPVSGRLNSQAAGVETRGLWETQQVWGGNPRLSLQETQVGGGNPGLSLQETQQSSGWGGNPGLSLQETWQSSGWGGNPELSLWESSTLPSLPTSWSSRNWL